MYLQKIEKGCATGRLCFLTEVFPGYHYFLYFFFQKLHTPEDIEEPIQVPPVQKVLPQSVRSKFDGLSMYTASYPAYDKKTIAICNQGSAKVKESADNLIANDFEKKSTAKVCVETTAYTELGPSISYKAACAPSEDLDQAAHARSLIRVRKALCWQLRIHSVFRRTGKTQI